MTTSVDNEWLFYSDQIFKHIASRGYANINATDRRMFINLMLKEVAELENILARLPREKQEKAIEEIGTFRRQVDAFEAFESGVKEDRLKAAFARQSQDGSGDKSDGKPE